MESYRDKLKSLGFISKPTTSKVTAKHYEDTDKVVAYEKEIGTPGTGVSFQQDAKIVGGEARLNPQVVKAMVNAEGNG